MHIFCNVKVVKNLKFEDYSEAHKNLNSCVKKLVNSNIINLEHKEIIFKSIYLPLIEDLFTSLNSK